MPVTSYQNGFPQGLTVRGMPIAIQHPGRIFWVSNSAVSSFGGVIGSNDGGADGAQRRPFSTINYALSRCVASRGDIIMVAPGHAETITTAANLVLNVAGVAIVGLGVGSLRPTLTFSTNTTANIPITAANVSVTNILHRANKADLVSFYTATGANTPTDFAIESCEFRDLSSSLNALKCVTGNATANSMDGFYFAKNRVFGLGTTAATQACIMAAANDRQTYLENYVVYPALSDTAALVDFGANSQTNLLMLRNLLVRPSTSSTGGLVFSGGSTASTGFVVWNEMWHLDNSAGLLFPTGTKLGFSNNYGMVTGAADKSALINPVAV